MVVNVQGFCKAHACHSKYDFYLYVRDIWNVVDWLSFLGGFIVILFWILYMDKLAQVGQSIIDVTTSRPADASFGAGSEVMQIYEENADRMHQQIAEFAANIQMLRVTICIYTLVLTTRFFKAFESQPRLAVVTQTIVGCLPDISHFFIVLTVLFFGYAIAGQLLFGHRMLEFSEMALATTECFDILLGAFDFDALSEEHPATAFMWFCTFIIVITMLMLNMTLAIIMDVYAEAKASAAASDPIWTQVAAMYQAFLKRAEMVRTQDFIDAAEEITEERINKAVLLEKIPNLGEEQAAHVIEQVDLREENDENGALSIAEALKLVGIIKLDVTKMTKKIDKIVKLEREGRIDLMQRIYGAGVKIVAAQNADGKTVLKVEPKILPMDPASDKRLRAVESRLDRMEEFLNEAMSYGVYRGKEMHQKMAAMEDELRAQRDASAKKTDKLEDSKRNPGAAALTNGA
eukprot:gnl/TRDRNA2_/TRDRNA2_147911_c0_seq1.p1 gnl/TRDRNA2_/TRDRNA2_147911_c0~~gnl/TRDRNA2_/TRDRNA2_147911_c0_seq1.p1  ORF type:complete len:528 (+),score=126.76 gnl/TRDRNA2_/TRDRNA2_147911_c0_seq1:203-1585(+)